MLTMSMSGTTRHSVFVTKWVYFEASEAGVGMSLSGKVYQSFGKQGFGLALWRTVVYGLVFEMDYT